MWDLLKIIVIAAIVTTVASWVWGDLAAVV